MEAKHIAARFLGNAILASKLTPLEVAQRSGYSRRAIFYILNCQNVKHCCRMDTLLALLQACGYELGLKRKTDA